MRFFLIAIIGILFAACSVDPPEGQLKCETSQDCPPEWKCDTDNLCYSDPDAGGDTSDTASDTTTGDSDTGL